MGAEIEALASNLPNLAPDSSNDGIPFIIAIGHVPEVHSPMRFNHTVEGPLVFVGLFPSTGQGGVNLRPNTPEPQT